MTEDTRTNTEIVAEARAVWNMHISDDRPLAEVIVAALSAAGRLVTPEHDARVLRDAAEAIKVAAPPMNAELTMTPNGPVEDRNMAAYVEGFHDAFDAINALAGALTTEVAA